MRAFGYIPDPEDSRDWDYALRASKRLATVRDSVDLREKAKPILLQGTLGACTSHAVMGAFRLKHRLSGIADPEVGSRLHGYAGARAYSGTLDWDAGAHIRDVFRFVNTVGFMRESETKNKYDVTKFRELPTPLEQKKMFDQKNRGDGAAFYYRVFGTGEDRIRSLQVALSSGDIPVLGTETTSAFLNYKGGILRKPKSNVRYTGGHAVYLVGYTSDYVITANSWEDWGLEGFGYLGWDYITWRETRDIWIVEKAPYYSDVAA